MASPNAQRVYELLAAYERGDDDAVRALIDPDGEIYTQPGLINVTEIGDSLIVMPVHITARGSGSGAEVQVALGWLYEWTDGRASRFHVYTSVEEALEAARRIGGR